MSIPIAQALELAEDVADTLSPLVEELKCVGSVRRQNARVGDIEFLARPFFDVDLLGGRTAITEPVKAAMHGFGRWLKGGTRQMVVSDLYGVEGVRLEVFLQHPPSEWGSLLAMRTGPAELGRYCVTMMRERGYRHVDGHVVRIHSHEAIPTPTEEAFFELAGVACVPPVRRDSQAVGLWAAYNADKYRGART